MRPFLLLAFLFVLTNTNAAKLESTTATAIEAFHDSSLSYTIYDLPTAKELGKQIGRKLSLKEKISLIVLKKYAAALPRDVESRQANSNATLGFVFALAALLIFPLFAIPGLIFSNMALKAEKLDPGILTNSNRGLAKAGQIISYVSIGLLVIGLLIIAAYLGLLFSR